MAPNIEQFTDLATRTVLNILPNAELVVCEPTNNSAAYVDYKDKKVTSRITYWEDGNVFVERYDVQTGNELFSISAKVDAKPDLNAILLSYGTKTQSLA